MNDKKQSDKMDDKEENKEENKEDKTFEDAKKSMESGLLWLEEGLMHRYLQQRAMREKKMPQSDINYIQQVWDLGAQVRQCVAQILAGIPIVSASMRTMNDDQAAVEQEWFIAKIRQLNEALENALLCGFAGNSRKKFVEKHLGKNWWCTFCLLVNDKDWYLECGRAQYKETAGGSGEETEDSHSPLPAERKKMMEEKRKKLEEDKKKKKGKGKKQNKNQKPIKPKKQKKAKQGKKKPSRKYY